MKSTSTRRRSPAHAKHLAKFRIPTAMLDAAGVQSVADGEVRGMLGVLGHSSDDLGGILFPYHEPMTGRRVGARVRLDHHLADGGKYIGEQGCRHLFFPPSVKHFLSDVNVQVVIVEAEKSALALSALAERTGRPMMLIAIGGCFGWRRKVGNLPLPNGGGAPETGPSPDFDFIAWDGRTVILAFDSNAWRNSAVRKARWTLAHELASRGAKVLSAEVTDAPGVNGPDDLVAIAGDNAALGMLDSARPVTDCAVAEATQLLVALEADKKTDPGPVIEAVAAVGDTARRELLMGRIVGLRIPGVSRAFVERQVKHYRNEAEAEREEIASTVQRSSLLALGETVSGAEVLEEVYRFVRRFVMLSETQACVVALWVLHTHIFSIADCTPYLAITSAEKQSGKTRLLEVLALLVANPWLTGKVSSAVLYRKIDAEHPTLLLDESDAAFNGEKEYAEALRGVLNTGYQRIGKASCCVGKGAELSYCDFSTFSPKAIAGIGNLPDTVADRAIPIRLKRAARGERIERFRRRAIESVGANLRNRVEAWSAWLGEMNLQDSRPQLPESLSDRQQDGAEPLLAIADAAGGNWPERARCALVELFSEAQAADESVGVRVLSDIRSIFDTCGTDRLASADLADGLAEIETSPWREWSHGRPISTPKLARLLGKFGITPGTIRFREGKTAKGYYREDFADAWRRYLRQNTPSDTPQVLDPCTLRSNSVTTCINTSENADLESVTPPSFGALKNEQKPNENLARDVVTVSNPSTGTIGVEEEL